MNSWRFRPRYVAATALPLVLVSSLAWSQDCRPYWVRPPDIGGADAGTYSTTGEVVDDGTGPGLMVVARFPLAPGHPSYMWRAGLARYRNGQWENLSAGLPYRSGMGQSVWDLGQGQGRQHLLGGPGGFTSANGAYNYGWTRYRSAAGLSLVPRILWENVGQNFMVSLDYGTGTFLYRNRKQGTFDIIERYVDDHWMQVGQALSGYANLIVVADDGSGPTLFVSGSFFAPLTSGFLKWTGSAWQPIDHSTAFSSSSIRTVASYNDGTGPKVYVGGNLASVGASPFSAIAAWDGVTWSNVAGGVTGGTFRQVNTLKVWDDGFGPKLYAAGLFTEMGGVPALSLAAWDGTRWRPVGAGGGGSARSIVEMEDRRGRSLFFVGPSVSVNAGPINLVAQLVACPNCYADCDVDGTLTVNDFICFTNAFATRDPYANCDSSPGFDMADYTCFINRYAAGCP